MTKDELRKLYLKKRLELSETDYAQLNEALCGKFFKSIDLSSIGVLHTFLPIEKNKEPDTRLVVGRIKREFPHIKFSLPKVNHETGELVNYYWEDADPIIQNKWGIPEPRQGVVTPSEKIDMVLVPLLVFDQQGHRIGYGKGYYDRFLSACRKDCKKIGISFFPPIETINSKEDHDQKLDSVITPERSYVF